MSRSWISLIFIWLCLGLPIFGEALEIGQYDNPRDFTLRITDPFAQENTDLLQPVVGDYSIKVLPQGFGDVQEGSAKYHCEGLYFKQIGKLIYIDVRKPPVQKRAGYYDLSVVLSLPKEGDFASYQKRAIRYVDSATDVVLVIDNSSSMRKNDPKNLRFDAAENFIHLSSLSSQINKVAILRFSNTAKTLLPWTAPKEVGDISKKFFRMRTGNFTNINRALSEGARLFENSSASEKVLVLLTDGRNEPDRYRDTHKQLKELGVKVHTVGLSKHADAKLLRYISSDTGGLYFKAVDDTNLLKIYNQIASEIGDFRTMVDGISQGELEFSATSSDHIINLNVFGYDRRGKFELIGPQGQQVPLNEITGKKNSSTSIFRLHKPKAGKYLLRFKGKKPNFNYNISTHSHLFLKAFPLENNYLRGEVVHFAASLAEQDRAITNVPVTGSIIDSSGKVMKELVLHDDGVHGDNHAGDGVYGAIWPLDLPEGPYSIILKAYGKDFVRMDKDSFYVLETGKSAKDYFLASILPLYIDLGKVEQGNSKLASLRLSFEGRGDRLIKFSPGEALALNQGNERYTIPWKSIQFPKTKKLKPSQSAIYSLAFNVPHQVPTGTYLGSVLITIGKDQEIEIPVDLIVTKGFGKGERLALDLEIKTRKIKHDPLAEQVKKTLELPLKDIVNNKETGPLTRRPDQSKNLIRSPIKKEIIKGPIDFSVNPSVLQPFSASRGQLASANFDIINHSTHAGTVRIALSQGPGDIDIDEILIPAGESRSINWTWDVEKAPEVKDIKLSFTHEDKSLIRELQWVPPQARHPLFFILTIIFLIILTIYFGARYQIGKKPPHLFLCLSSFVHLILVIIAFKSQLPNQAPIAYSNNDNVVLINESKDIELKATDPDFDELTYIIVDQPKYGDITGDLPNLTYTPKVQSEQLDRFTFKVNDGTNDSNIAEVNIEIKKEEEEEEDPIEIVFVEEEPEPVKKPEPKEVKVTKTDPPKPKPKEVEDIVIPQASIVIDQQKVIEVKPESFQPVIEHQINVERSEQPNLNHTIDAQDIALPTIDREADSERTWVVEHTPEITKPQVMSINDRPNRRARMRKKVEKVETAQDLSNNKNEDEIQRQNKALAVKSVNQVKLKDIDFTDIRSIDQQRMEYKKEVPLPSPLETSKVNIKKDDVSERIARKQLKEAQAAAKQLELAQKAELNAQRANTAHQSQSGNVLPASSIAVNAPEIAKNSNLGSRNLNVKPDQATSTQKLKIESENVKTIATNAQAVRQANAAAIAAQKQKLEIKVRKNESTADLASQQVGLSKPDEHNLIRRSTDIGSARPLAKLGNWKPENDPSSKPIIKSQQPTQNVINQKVGGVTKTVVKQAVVQQVSAQKTEIDAPKQESLERVANTETPERIKNPALAPKEVDTGKNLIREDRKTLDIERPMRKLPTRPIRPQKKPPPKLKKRKG